MRHRNHRHPHVAAHDDDAGAFVDHDLGGKVGVTEDGKRLALVKEGMSLQQLVDGLNALGIGPRDMIAILQAIKAAGAIQADIEVM